MRVWTSPGTPPGPLTPHARHTWHTPSAWPNPHLAKIARRFSAEHHSQNPVPQYRRNGENLQLRHVVHVGSLSHLDTSVKMVVGDDPVPLLALCSCFALAAGRSQHTFSPPLTRRRAGQPQDKGRHPWQARGGRSPLGHREPAFVALTCGHHGGASHATRTGAASGWEYALCSPVHYRYSVGNCHLNGF
jgi:hypothetical protein